MTITKNYVVANDPNNTSTELRGITILANKISSERLSYLINQLPKTICFGFYKQVSVEIS